MTEAQARLLARAKELARRYRDSIADLVAVIAESDRVRLFEAAGCPSLFAFCVAELLLSEDEAYKMIRAARAARQRPEVLSFLAEGSLSPRAVAVLAPEVKAPDFCELLERAKNVPFREVEKLVALRHPEAPPRETVRVLAAPAAEPERPASVLYRLSFNADEELRARIERAKGLLRHRHPEGKLEDVIREAVEALLLDLDPLAREPAQARPGARKNPWARRVPPAVRDEVWRRDGGRCAFVGNAGRCAATTWLELDHVVPWALGGRSDDPGNLRLLCRAHNQSEGRRLAGGAPGELELRLER